MVKISVTVPVYNVESYLKRCLDTIMNQSFKGEYEVICVDDGSTDNSGKILDDYAAKYPNLKVIHQENQGLSEARNTAMQYVTGKYTMFVDSDDCIALDALEGLYKYIQEYRCDVVIFDFLRSVDGTNKVTRQTFPNISKKYGTSIFNADTAEPFVYRFIPVATWNKIYRTDLIKDIKFVKDLNNQDVVHWAEVYTKARRVSYYPVPFYKYTMRRADAITQIKGKKAFDLFRAFPLAREVLKKSGYFEKFKTIHYSHFVSNMINALRKINPELRKELVKTIIECPVDVDYEKFQEEDFFTFEKENMLIIKYMKEHNLERVYGFLEGKGIWK